MKILFVCGGLEAGRDGVGDYCRRMAAAGRDAGWEAALLAIHDGAERTFDEETAPPPTLRLPRGAPWYERRQRAAEFLAAQRPDWVSLQFVCYALDPKGVIFRWIPRLADLVDGHRVHLMFHEIWIGASTEYVLRDRLLGAVQRHSIRQLTRRLRPAAAHTTNCLYQQLLAQIGVAAGRLALPGNIPIAPGTAPAAGFPELDRAKSWVGGVFGAIHPRWQPEPWLEESAALAARVDRKLVLVQFGEAGSAGREAWARIEAAYRNRVPCFALGPREPEEISRILAQLDFGIATSPWVLIEKSGATAAFLDHGVPVLVPRNDWQLRAGFTAAPVGDPLLFCSAAALFRALPSQCTPADRVGALARGLGRDLARALE